MNPNTPSGYGLGLRSQHWNEVLETTPCEVEWFEIISENFINTQGYPRDVLAEIRSHYPVVMHGVSLSIGSADALNHDYLTRLKALADWLQPAWISDHICWTGIHQKNTHDLLPLPYTQDSLVNCVNKIDEVQEFLGRQILLENPSNYMEFAANEMPEWEFVTALLERADCKLLLDINNIYVTCFNHRLNPKTYIDAIPAHRIGQIHLAGHAHQGTHIIDTHDAPVNDEVLALYAYAIRTKGVAPTMIEWDANIPSFATMLAELNRVKSFAEIEKLPNFTAEIPHETTNAEPFSTLMQHFQTSVLQRSEPKNWVQDKPEFSAAQQMNVYHYAYRKQLFDAVTGEYAQTQNAMGEESFSIAVRSYIEQTPSQFYALEPYIVQFAQFVKSYAPKYFALAFEEAEISQLRQQPQPQTLTPHAFSALPPEQFLQHNLTLTEAVKLLPKILLLCEKLEVYRTPVIPLEYTVLQAIHQSESLEVAIHRLYDQDHCTAENVLPTVQQVLMDFLPKRVFKALP